MAHIDYYFTMLSPFTYLAGLRLEEIAARQGASITYKPFNLAALGKETGFVPLPQRPQVRQAYRMQELARISGRVGLPINRQPAHWPTNPVPASTAIISAQKAGGGDVGQLTHALLRASWAEEKDIAEDAVIRAALEGAGFDPGLADSGMLSAVETLEHFTNEALAAGVFGSPSYVVGDQLFWGQDRLDYLEDHLAALAGGA